MATSISTGTHVLALAAEVLAHRSGMTRGQAEAVLVDVSQEVGVATDDLAALVVNAAAGLVFLREWDHSGDMSHQVIYRRGRCQNCQRDTVHRVRQTIQADGDIDQEFIDCTECKQGITP